MKSFTTLAACALALAASTQSRADAAPLQERPATQERPASNQRPATGTPAKGTPNSQRPGVQGGQQRPGAQGGDQRPATQREGEQRPAAQREGVQGPAAQREGVQGQRPAAERQGNSRGEMPESTWTDREILARMAKELSTHNERIAKLNQIGKVLEGRGAEAEKLRQVAALKTKEMTRYETMTGIARTRIGAERFNKLLRQLTTQGQGEGQRPAAGGERPATGGERPAGGGERPAPSGERPANGERPAGERPANGERPGGN